MMESWSGPPDPDFDEDIAEGFIGKYLLVGITRVTHEGEIKSQQQLHGVISAVTAYGIDVELRGVNEGQVWRMPLFFDEFSVAKEGIYELKSTGEIVENPDFTFTLTITEPLKQ